jgi:predicted 3-demethylubiquinone-9 3-methyltransferase (glyoxalase superfamily)
MTNAIRTCLWFRDGRGREAADFYCSLIPNSRIGRTFSGDAGQGAFHVIDFTLGGVPYQILDAGPHFTLTEAVSISVETPDQAETDRLWAALTADGGQESVCGWLKDRQGSVGPGHGRDDEADKDRHRGHRGCCGRPRLTRLRRPRAGSAWHRRGKRGQPKRLFLCTPW